MIGTTLPLLDKLVMVTQCLGNFLVHTSACVRAAQLSPAQPHPAGHSISGGLPRS